MDVIPLSDLQVSQKLQKHGLNIPFIKYEDLRYVDNIDDILPCFLLYQIHIMVGHWTALFRDKVENKINYFDPTGKFPDQLLITNFDHPAGRSQMGADFTYLVDLLKKTGESIVYNEYPLQYPTSTNTCGYHVTIRLLFQNLTNDQYNDCWKPYSAEERQRKVVKLFNLL